MIKKKGLPKIQVKLREIKEFDNTGKMREFVDGHNLNGYEFACGWKDGNLKNKCFLTRVK